MDRMTEKKLGFLEPELAYDLPETMMRIRKHIQIGYMDALPRELDDADALLDMVKKDVESHLLILQKEINKTRELIE